LNATVAAPAEKFVAKYFPIPASSTEILVAELHLKGGFCVETWSGLPLDRRIAYQRAAVESFLNAVSIDFRYSPALPKTNPPKPVRP
jgi:hypothetical protein